jgi:hypothetical protein
MFTRVLTIIIVVVKSIWTVARLTLGKILNSDGSKGIYL